MASMASSMVHWQFFDQRIQSGDKNGDNINNNNVVVAAVDDDDGDDDTMKAGTHKEVSIEPFAMHCVYLRQCLLVMHKCKGSFHLDGKPGKNNQTDILK